MPLYPFTDVLVLPKSVMDKYGEEMKKDGRLSILREKTQEILRAKSPKYSSVSLTWAA